MTRLANWENQIGTRLRLRDLHVLFTVVEHGSMSKAAAELGISQPAVSDVITNLEHSLGVKLLDRNTRGVEPTIYGQAFLKRSIAAFDELKQGIRDINFLSDPSSGEVRIGCLDVVTAILPPFIRRFSQQHPRVVINIDIVAPSSAPEGARLLLGPGLTKLRERELDLFVGIVPTAFTEQPLGDDLAVEVLFADSLIVAAGAQSYWARRRKIELAELVDAPWVLANANAWNYAGLAETFRAHRLPLPAVSIVAFSLPLRVDLLANGDYITIFTKSVAERYPVKALPIPLPPRPLSGVVIKPKDRTLSPVVERFIDCAREVAGSFGSPTGTQSRAASRRDHLGDGAP